MTDPQGSRRSKWTLDWPVMSHARVANDNPSPSVQTELSSSDARLSLYFFWLNSTRRLGSNVLYRFRSSTHR